MRSPFKIVAQVLLWTVLSLPAIPQTSMAPNQIKNFTQVNWDWWRACAADGSSSYFDNPTPATYEGQVWPPQPPSTRVAWTQIRNGGVTISADGSTVTLLRPYGVMTTIQAVGLPSGVIELRYAASTPNFNLVGLIFADLAFAGAGGWAVTEGQALPQPAQIELALTAGVFSFRAVRPYLSSCDNW